MGRSERLKQSSKTGKIRPIIEMVSMTNNPIGTLFAVWHGSRHDYTVSAEDIQAIYDSDAAYLSDKVTAVDADWKRRAEIADKICKDYPEHAGADGTDVKNVTFFYENGFVRRGKYEAPDTDITKQVLNGFSST